MTTDAQMGHGQAAIAQAEFSEVFGLCVRKGDQNQTRNPESSKTEQGEERRPKYSRGEEKGGKGGSWSSGSGDTWYQKRQGWSKSADKRKWGEEREEVTLDAPPQQLLQAIVRLSLRHEQELGMIRRRRGS